MKKLKTFDSSYFIGKSHFEEDGTQNYLVFQPINRYFKVIANTKYISTWKSKRLSDESIKPPATSDNSLSLLINYLDNKRRLKFNEGCLIQQNKPTYTHSTIVNLYIVYELSGSGSSSNDPILRNPYLVQLNLIKMVILISIDISVIELDLMEKEVFHFGEVDSVKI